MSIPSADEQVAFLRHVQRLLEEGQFVATYKFALLLALSDLCVELGDDSGEELTLPVRAIADKFLALYWTHTNPYPTRDPGGHGIISQNLGRNIALLHRVAELRRRIASLADARRSRQWSRLRTEAAKIIREMPLFRLQTLRGAGELTFLYRNRIEHGAVRLLPGVAFHFRQFHGLVQHLVRGAWIRHVRANPRNDRLLGEATVLEEFLFGSSRVQYPLLKVALREVQDGKCFYCGTRVGKDGELDHFIPWVKYPADLGHNFVLADRRCNGDKSDRLAERRFLVEWRERNEAHDRTLGETFQRAALSNDRRASERIADWAYALADSSGAAFWRPGFATHSE